MRQSAPVLAALALCTVTSTSNLQADCYLVWDARVRPSLNSHDHQTYPDVAIAPDAKAIVAWESFDDPDRMRLERREDVHVSFVSPDGSVQFEAESVPISPDGRTWPQGVPRIAVDRSGGFVLSWADASGRDGDGHGVYARRFAEDGTSLDQAEFQVNTVTEHDQDWPDIGVDGDGNFAVVWETVHQPSGINIGVFARFYTAQGVPVGPEVRLDDGMHQPHYPAISASDSGFVAVWVDFITGDLQTAVRARRFLADGTPIGDEISVTEPTDRWQRWTDVDARPSGGFVTVWQQALNDEAGADIWGRRFDRMGKPLDGLFRVNEATVGEQDSAAIESDGDGSFVVVWETSQQGVDGQRIGGQLFDPDGDRLGHEFELGTGVSQHPSVSIRDGNVIVAWQEFPDGADDVDIVTQWLRRCPDHCSNGVRDEGESDVDCGGECGPCQNDGGCEFAGDCDSGYCSPDGRCSAPSCDDGWRNGDETGVDCGGSCSEACEIEEPCPLVEERRQIVTEDLKAAGFFAAPDGSFLALLSGPEGLLAQRLDSTGTSQGEARPIGMCTGDCPNSLAFDSTGGFAIAWVVGEPTQSEEVVVQLFDPNAEPLAPRISLDSLPGSDRFGAPSVVRDSENQLLITWLRNATGNAGDPSHVEVYLQRISSDDGSPLGQRKLVSRSWVPPAVSFLSSHWNARAASHPDGTTVVAWPIFSGFEDPGSFVPIISLVARRYTVEGRAVGRRITVIERPRQLNLDLDVDLSGNVVVSWVAGPIDAEQAYVKRFDANWNPLGDAIPVGTTELNINGDFGVQVGPEGRFAVHSTVGDSVDVSHLAVRRFDGHGNPLEGETFFETHNDGYSAWRVDGGLWVLLTTWSPQLRQNVVAAVQLVEDCHPSSFRRGDVDASGSLEITDPISNLAHQFLGAFDPPCRDALDFDDSGTLEVTDPIANLTHQFVGGPPPAPPGEATCGVDPTDDDLTCDSFAACPER